MEFDYGSSFLKDLRKLPKEIQKKTEILIAEVILKCNSLSEIPHLEKVKKQKDSYRIRIGDYRIGFKYDEKITFQRIKHRKDIYKFFPIIF